MEKRFDPLRRRRLGNATRYAGAGLLLFPAAVGLPIVETAHLGRRVETNLLEGVARLWRSGHLLLAAVVGFCSILLPAAKLAAAWYCARGGIHPGRRRLAVLDALGRYGMLDVFVIALLVCILKLGDWVAVRPLPGLFALVAVVGLSFLATAELRAGLESAGGTER